MQKISFITLIGLLLLSCKDDENVYDTSFRISQLITDGGMQYDDVTYSGVWAKSPLKLRFTQPVDRASVEENVSLMPFDDEENVIDVEFRYEANDSVVELCPQGNLDFSQSIN